MDLQQQCSTVTQLNRHPAILKLFEKSAPRAILSFGCSEGYELLSLHYMFPDASIVGVDINEAALQVAREKTAASAAKITVLHSADRAAICARGPYDLITCFSVLCNFPSRTLTYQWETFAAVMRELCALLSPDGSLACFNSNYSAADFVAENPSLHLRRIRTRVRQTQVPLYGKDGSLKSLDDKNFYIVKRAPPRAKTHLGILGYSLSSNVGDYFQTLAQINLLSFFYNSRWTADSPAILEALAYFARLKPRTPDWVPVACRQRLYDKAVHVHWIDRDTISEVDMGGAPVWVIMNGWYAHKKPHSSEYSWPPARDIHPLFISFHCQQEDFLDARAIEYFRQHEPIGCRDINTVRLLHSKNIQAWFSGCLTTTLDSAARNEPSTGARFAIDMREVGADETAVKHLQPAIRAGDFEGALSTCLEYYKSYSRAETIRTSRLHAYLPSLAMDIPDVEFSSPAGDRGPAWLGRARFEGLIQRSEDARERELHALAMTNRVVEALDRLIVSQLAPAEVIRAFQYRSALGCADISARAAEHYNLNESFPAARWSDVRLNYPAILAYSGRRIFGDSECIDTKYTGPHCLAQTLRTVPLRPFARRGTVLVTFDASYVDLAPVMLRSLSLSNPHILWHVYCVTRGVQEAEFARFRTQCAKLGNIVVFQRLAQGCYEKYFTHLPHVSDSCMDRLMIADLEYADEPARVLYLDLDILVLGNLEPLLDVDVGPTGIAARNSLGSYIVSTWLKRADIAGLTYDLADSFNAGVFVADPEILRARNFTAFCTELARAHGINDQIILNMYCQAQHAPLPGEYNTFVGQEVAPPTSRILHFVGSKKPWLAGSAATAESKKLWTYYADELYLPARITRG